MSLQELLDFGSIPVFKANVDTCIVLAENTVSAREAFLAATFRNKADIPRLSEAFQERAFSMHTCDLSPDRWALTSTKVLRLLEKLQHTGTPLGEYVEGRFYHGVKTGCNDAFIIDDSMHQQLITEDIRSSELMKPVLRGKDLCKWKTEPTDKYLIAIASSANLEWPWSDAANDSEAEDIFAQTYPAIYEHLNGYQERLRARDDQGKFYWELRSCTYYAEFGEPKIIYPQTAKSLYACYDITNTFCLQTTYFFPTTDLSLLAILGSTLFDWYVRHKLQSLNDPWAGGRLQFKKADMQDAPIANGTSEQKAALSQLVERILVDPEGDKVNILEQEIDEQVYQLYGLTCEEIALIRQTYEEAGMQR